MAKTKKTTRKAARAKISSDDQEIDSIFLLKLVLYMILGTFWIRLSRSDGWMLPLPVGLLIGLMFATHDHFKIDRKIEFAVLLIAMFVSFWLPLGLFIRF